MLFHELLMPCLKTCRMTSIIKSCCVTYWVMSVRLFARVLAESCGLYTCEPGVSFCDRVLWECRSCEGICEGQELSHHCKEHCSDYVGSQVDLSTTIEHGLESTPSSLNATDLPSGQKVDDNTLAIGLLTISSILMLVIVVAFACALKHTQRPTVLGYSKQWIRQLPEVRFSSFHLRGAI